MNPLTKDGMKMESVGKMRAVLGEGIYWSPKTESLMWVDIKGCKIIRWHPAELTETVWSCPDEIGFIIDDPNSGHFLGALRKGLAHIVLPRNGGMAQITYISQPETDLPHNRFNDGGIDRFGNVWAGTMDDRELEPSGNWWQFNPAGQAKLLLSDFQVTNGPAFSPRDDIVYLNDSARLRTYRARYDATGLVSEVKVWKEYQESQGYPDGMAFDANGLLWIAFWDGACLRAFDEGGKLRAKLDLPVRRPTKPAFDSGNSCYITSASIGLDSSCALSERWDDKKLDGRVLRVGVL